MLSAWLGDSNQTYVDPFPILGTLKISTCIALGVLLAVGALIWTILNMPRIADALIETEIEMQKVTWPSWGETWSGTLAVVAMVLILFVYLFVVDIGLARVMVMLMGGGAA